MSDSPRNSARPRKSRIWSTRRARWLLNFYPPFLFNRVVVRSIAEDWRSLELTIERSLLNKNLNGTTFGGSISAAADPIHAILFDQALVRRKVPAVAWTKRLTVRFVRPAKTRLRARFELGPSDLDDAARDLAAAGRFERTYEVSAVDLEGLPCAQIEVQVHLRGIAP